MRFASPLLAFWLALSPVAAWAQPFEFNGAYSFSWNGLPFGRLTFQVHETEDRYEAHSTLASSYLGQIFSPMDCRVRVEGKRSSGWGESARTYEAAYTSNQKPRRVKLVYAAGGDISEEIVEPPENRAKRPEVPAEQKKASLDPLTYVFAARKALQEAERTGSKDFSLRLYEGRRLMDTFYHVEGPETLALAQGSVDALAVSVTRSAVAGYTQKELARLAAGDPPLIVYFSRDGRWVPLRLELRLSLGSVRADLGKECSIGDECVP